jgi:hypothetical protein
MNGTRCGRRVLKLFLPPFSKSWGCRRCHNLINQSARQHDARVDRLAEDPAAILDALGAWGRQTVLAVKALELVGGRLERRWRRYERLPQQVLAAFGEPDDFAP